MALSRYSGTRLPSSRRFTLLGHDCPYGKYPAPVIPIGKLDDELVAIYPGNQPEPSVEKLPGNCRYVRHGRRSRAALRDFDYRRDRLFAYSPREIVCYAGGEEARFLSELLGSSRSRGCSPEIRRMIEDHLTAPVVAEAPSAEAAL